MQDTRTVDCLEVGAGPAGLTAAHGLRCFLRCFLRCYQRQLVVADHGHSRALDVERSHNHRAIPQGLSGQELLQRLRQQVAQVQGEVRDVQIASLENDRHPACAAAAAKGYCGGPPDPPLTPPGLDMTIDFEELDYQVTPLGALILRRRMERSLGIVVHEIKLGDAFLMSSLFTASEEALARLGLAVLDHDGLDVLVGGLGLGCTAATVLEDARVRSLHVVELLAPVIDWHRDGLLPLGPTLTADPRCHFVQGDFFALSASSAGFVSQQPGKRFDAILVDIDHAPDYLLGASSASFYTPAGLALLSRHLVPGGVFGLWSNDPPDDGFEAVLAQAFGRVQAHVVHFPNPYRRQDASCTVYLAVKPGAASPSAAPVA